MFLLGLRNGMIVKLDVQQDEFAVLMDHKIGIKKINYCFLQKCFMFIDFNLDFVIMEFPIHSQTPKFVLKESNIETFFLNEKSSDLIVLFHSGFISPQKSNISLQQEIDLSDKKEQKISLVYKNTFKSQKIQISIKKHQIPFTIINNFLCFHFNHQNTHELKQIDYFSLFENIIQKKDYVLAKEFILRFLKGNKNQESKHRIMDNL